MKLTSIVKTKKGYVFIDTCLLDKPMVNMLDSIGFGNDDAVAGEYETMVFPCNKKGEVKDWGDLDKGNYPTEAKAKPGHATMVKKWGKEIKKL